MDWVLSRPAVAALAQEHGRTAVLAQVRSHLRALRAAALAGTMQPEEAEESRLAQALARNLAQHKQPRLRRVFNLTGTVLHTNLGRALLPREAVEEVAMSMCQPCNLEYDLEQGERGDRDRLVEGLLCELTGAQAATVVNNNAAAVLLTLAALAARKEVVISRGELVEIGGAFRMPEVMASARAKMVEVGTTNRTHAWDYERAISVKTALIMKVHTSNYAIQGFACGVNEASLAAIAQQHHIPFAVDLGSGSLVDLSAYGLPKEPTPHEAILAGADVVTFSGDKLLGGPQAGLIVGKSELVKRIKKHPLKRALRVSKLTLAGLEATLRLYGHPETLAERLPTLRLLTRSSASIEALTHRLLEPFASALQGSYRVHAQPMSSQIGSGSLPVDRLASFGLAIRPVSGGKREGTALKWLARALRDLPIPVIGRISDGCLLLDLRCLEDEEAFVAQLPRIKPRAAP